MLSAKLVFASLFAFVASAFAAELDLRTLKETGHNDLGLFTVVEGRHSLKLGWFKPLVGKEVQKVRCGTHELWSTAEKEHELHELLVLSKCKEAAFAVVSELTAIGGLAHHYLELDPVAGTLRKKYDGGNTEEFQGFVKAVLLALRNVGAVEALQKPYPAVAAHFFFRHLRLAGERAAAQAGHKPELMQ
ncbi:signal peptide containing protein [Theileria equi strain WA]|uniref:Signal peptide containing protein n=1 Tax=Theileria equi strain WA TaxID=1537102 RepID=L1L9I1_THEEQ|nr:signal peptide containing protein [Theileria equi strain WA]EKX72072.1 signal peptide containing protein [Theileria equi strain WA]|eukprot:XP_004831524.1 signal peptide containing protein [Theileria equi strain WA]